jgi:hypothetical protein
MDIALPATKVLDVMFVHTVTTAEVVRTSAVGPDEHRLDDGGFSEVQLPAVVTRRGNDIG